MKKNISINISGIIFHIEEDGYDTLRQYLDSINAYFSSFKDNSEILADIESRIAELFLSKLNEGKQVITREDVDNLIHTMGSVSDFKAAEEQELPPREGPASHSRAGGSSQKNSAHKKLYRDQRRKILGGVSAGLAHYFNIDPVWIRLLLALLVLGSYGGLLLVYIILWIALPASAELEEEQEIKKMFRDGENKVLGGVASGVAAFFGTDSTIIRVLFVIFSFAGGLGFLIYLILWVALPEAKSITEKMQMQGEPVTLSNIETKVKQGLNEKDEEESMLAKIILFPFRLIALVITGLAKALGPIFTMTIDVLRVAVGILITLVGLTTLVALIFSVGVFLGMLPLSSLSFLLRDAPVLGLGLPVEAIQNTFPLWVTLTAFTFVVIPFLFIVLLGISIVARKLIFTPLVGWTLFVLFFVCFVLLSLSVPQIIRSFKEEGSYKEEVRFSIENKTPVLTLRETGLDDYPVVSLRIIGHDHNGLIRLVKEFESQGPSRLTAIENAKMLDYQVSQNDSIITFDSNVAFKKGAKFHAQRLAMDLYIPYDQPFVIDEELWRIIKNNRRFYEEEKSTNTWILTPSGLSCTSCNSLTENTSGQSVDALTGFNAISMSGLWDVTIEQSEDFNVEVRGSEKQKEHYEIFMENGKLTIDYDSRFENSFWKNNMFKEDKVKIYITLPSLEKLELKGAGDVNFGNFEETDVTVDIAGAIHVDGRLAATNLEVDITGASSLELDGHGVFLDARVNGASRLDAYDYEADRVIVEAHGASSAKVYANESLEINKSFASRVSHRGDPEVIKNQ